MNNVCLSAHPLGLREAVKEQIAYVKKQKAVSMPKRILVLGGSTGFGLATRIAATFAGGADTICVSFEREGSEKQPGTPGWYNNRYFKEEAEKAGFKAININGDAFSNHIKHDTIAAIKSTFGQVDLVVYSLASPVRKDPDSLHIWKSVLKPIGQLYTAQSVDFMKEKISTVSINPANPSEIEHTIKVMGGEDWEIWMNELKKAGVLANGVKTVAYTYIGPEMTYPIYRKGTIGKAKEHIESTALKMDKELAAIKGRAFISVNKALVTRASAVIPVVPLYISLLFKVMKKKGTHEGCIEQMYRMLDTKIYGKEGIVVDETKMIRMDDWEMATDVQKEISNLWDKVTEENLRELTDIVEYRRDYMKLHGFDVDGVDYSADVPVEIF
jgi:enoyl-[acyl-carrier protein] reductase/trans-2-enoyl-CoA reductase (NAD+)